jgi:hypothetical protein
MRRALLTSLALVAALSACSVDVEGAKCTVVGSTANCPSGQKCGTDLTCSVRAASCTACEVDGSSHCAVGSTQFLQCSDASDPACGTWTVVKTCAAGLQTCQVPTLGGDPDCACDAWTVVPGGVDMCTRPSISSAIAEAMKFPNPKVLLGGAASATYGNELDDAAPIVIPAGLTLIGDDTSSAAATNRIIAVQGPGPEGLQVHSGASVQGVAVQRAAGGPTIGVLLAGGPPASGYALLSVRVDGGGAGGAFATGLRIAGANAVAVADVLVRQATVAGLEVNRLGAADTVQVSQSNFDGNQVGVSLLRGDLTLSGSTVKRSVAEGVTSVGGAASLSIQDGLIANNLATGIFISSVQKLVLERTRVCGNTGTDRLYGGLTRKVGGLYSLGPKPLQLTFAGNRFHDNTGDQMYVVASTDTWDISGPGGCSIGVPNVFAGYTAPGVGLAALATNVLALNNAWKASFPTAGVDYAASGTCGGAACQIDVGTGSGKVCLPTDPADLTCPAP